VDDEAGRCVSFFLGLLLGTSLVVPLLFLFLHWDPVQVSWAIIAIVPWEFILILLAER